MIYTVIATAVRYGEINVRVARGVSIKKSPFGNILDEESRGLLVFVDCPLDFTREHTRMLPYKNHHPVA
jgi:hypothetical protein